MIIASTTKGIVFRFECADEVDRLWHDLKHLYDWSCQKSRNAPSGYEPPLVFCIQHSDIPEDVSGDLLRLGKSVLVSESSEGARLVLVTTPSGFSVRFRNAQDLKTVWTTLERMAREGKRSEKQKSEESHVLVYIVHEDGLPQEDLDDLFDVGKSLAPWESSVVRYDPSESNTIPGIPVPTLGERQSAPQIEGFKVIQGGQSKETQAYQSPPPDIPEA